MAAGQATIAAGGLGLFESTGFILVAVAALIVAVVMFRGKIFGRVTPWVGILTNGLFLTNYISLGFVSSTSILSTALFSFLPLFCCLYGGS